jgi:hypothetical protein
MGAKRLGEVGNSCSEPIQEFLDSYRRSCEYRGLALAREVLEVEGDYDLGVHSNGGGKYIEDRNEGHSPQDTVLQGRRWRLGPLSTGSRRAVPRRAG